MSVRQDRAKRRVRRGQRAGQQAGQRGPGPGPPPAPPRRPATEYELEWQPGLLTAVFNKVYVPGTQEYVICRQAVRKKGDTLPSSASRTGRAEPGSEAGGAAPGCAGQQRQRGPAQGLAAPPRPARSHAPVAPYVMMTSKSSGRTSVSALAEGACEAQGRQSATQGCAAESLPCDLRALDGGQQAVQARPPTAGCC